MRRSYRSLLPLILLLIAGLVAGPAAAQSLNVQIVGGLKTATPVAVVPFAQQGGSPLPTDVADVIRNDLNRCGKFRSLAVSEIVEQPSQGSDIKFATWRLLKQDYLIIGRIKDAGNGMVTRRIRTVGRQPPAALAGECHAASSGERPAQRGAPDRRCHLPADHRRPRRFLDPHRLHHGGRHR